MTLPPLESRTALPEALRLLLPDFPRPLWQGHRNFDGLVAFWLDRHLNFRALTARMQADARLFLDRKLDPQAHATGLLRLGNRFLQELHGHHRIEDAHFFPRLTALEPRLVAGFDMLETDHQAIDGLLQRFAAAANAVLQSPEATDPVATFHAELGQITALLDRHLTDEEDLIVPVILRHGPGAVE